MDTTTLREARRDEATFIAQMVRRMVTEMARHGGSPPATDEAAWDAITAAIAAELKGDSTKYVIAEEADGTPVGVGGADLVISGGDFAPRKTLHISVVYVLPQFRRGGIGGKLLARMLDWGRASGAALCDLNVLSENPARSLYEKHGFAVSEIRMVRSLS